MLVSDKHNWKLTVRERHLSLIKNVLSNIPYRVRFKPYVIETLRYSDEDPAFGVIQNYKNIEYFDKIHFLPVKLSCFFSKMLSKLFVLKI